MNWPTAYGSFDGMDLAFLRQAEHRPWPLPGRPWRMAMVWHDLLFAHWPVEANALRPLIPAGLEIDTLDGQAWLGVVAFHMTGVRHRLAPVIPWLSAFPEINVRTYVRAGDRRGVWFLSLDASRGVAVCTARWTYSLRYHRAAMRVEPRGDWVHFETRRLYRGVPPVEFV